jgi:hypothetical protein
MSANSVKYHQRSAPMLIFVTLIAGISGMVYQYFLDGTMLTFMVTTSAIGGLAGASRSFDERDRQLLWQSYAKAFEVLFMVIFFVYALMLLAGGLHLGIGVIEYINGHWLSLLASTLCILLGSAGLHYFRDAG